MSQGLKLNIPHSLFSVSGSNWLELFLCHNHQSAPALTLIPVYQHLYSIGN